MYSIVTLSWLLDRIVSQTRCSTIVVRLSKQRMQRSVETKKGTFKEFTMAWKMVVVPGKASLGIYSAGIRTV